MSMDLSGARWFKSSHSGGKDDCLEAAHLEGGMVGVRDSKNPSGGTLAFSPGAWDSFTAYVLNGENARS